MINIFVNNNAFIDGFKNLLFMMIFSDPLLRSNHSATELLASATIPENLKKSVVSDAAQVEDPQRSLRPRLWSWGSRRFRVAVMLALALSIEGFMRSNINMAMICMVNKTASGVAESKTRVALDSGCIIDKSESKKMNPFILQVRKFEYWTGYYSYFQILIIKFCLPARGHCHASSWTSLCAYLFLSWWSFYGSSWWISLRSIRTKKPGILWSYH